MSADHQALIAEALAAHERLNDAWRWACSCSESAFGGYTGHTRHVAAALLDSPEFAAVLADVRAGVLREVVGEIERLERIGQTAYHEIPDADWEPGDPLHQPGMFQRSAPMYAVIEPPEHEQPSGDAARWPVPMAHHDLDREGEL